MNTVLSPLVSEFETEEQEASYTAAYRHDTFNYLAFEHQDTSGHYETNVGVSWLKKLSQNCP